MKKPPRGTAVTREQWQGNAPMSTRRAEHETAVSKRKGPGLIGQWTRQVDALTTLVASVEALLQRTAKLGSCVIVCILWVTTWLPTAVPGLPSGVDGAQSTASLAAPRL